MSDQFDDDKYWEGMAQAQAEGTWADVVEMIERGERVHKEDLSVLLKHAPKNLFPQLVLDHIADHLEGRIGKGRCGRLTPTSTEYYDSYGQGEGLLSDIMKKLESKKRIHKEDLIALLKNAPENLFPQQALQHVIDHLAGNIGQGNCSRFIPQSAEHYGFYNQEMVKLFNSLREEGVKYEDALRVVGEKYYLSPERIKHLIPRQKKA